jgi:hypothetical protein
MRTISFFESIDTFDFIIAVIGIIALFLLIREVLMWYWKINRILEKLEQIEENTRHGNASWAESNVKNIEARKEE